MCFSGPSIPRDNSGYLAQQAEIKRQNDIRGAQNNIDTAFAGFDDKYYGDYTQKYKDAYAPKVDDQYAKARANLVQALARSGNLTSSYGATQMGDLEKTRGENYAAIGDQATEATNKLKQTVQQNRTNLYGLAQSASDPTAAAAQAPAIAATLDTPVAVSPLGDMFSQFTSIAANAAAAERQGYYGTGTGLFGPGRGAYSNGSSMIVGA